MQRIVASLILVSALLIAAVPAVAHHAFATEFDAQKPVTMKGIVTKIDWVNPHVWFYINVKNDNGTITFSGAHGEIKVNIDQRKAAKFVELLADEIVAAAQQTAVMMKDTLIAEARGEKLIQHSEADDDLA